ncbi:MAG: cytochrome c biogenesis protein CcsA [Phycisphaeraceae bacterium]
MPPLTSLFHGFTRATGGLSTSVILAAALFLSPAAPAVADAPTAPAPHETHAADSNAAVAPGAPAPAAAAAPASAAHRSHATMAPEAHRAFADAVDLSHVRRLAAFDGGRVKILDTLARERINNIFGREQWRDLIHDQAYDPVFTYLDMLFNKGYYADKPVIHVEVLALRRQMVRPMDLDSIYGTYADQEPAPDADLTDPDQWLRYGRLSPLMLNDPAAQQALNEAQRDLRLFNARQRVVNAWNHFMVIGSRLAVVSPAPNEDTWRPLLELEDMRLAAAAGYRDLAPSGITNPDAARAAQAAFASLGTAWRAGDAPAVNDALASLADALPQINPETYPAGWTLALEHLYNATHRFTIGYAAYLVGTLALLIAFAVGRRWLIYTGVTFLLLGFAVHSGGILTRMILSGRWPIHNQFESFFAVAWFAVLMGTILMIARRQWLFGAAAAALGTASLLVANTMPIPSSSIAPDMAILASSNILYIHVNIMLLGYALIGLAFFISLLYLGLYYFGNNPTDAPRRDGADGDGAHEGGGGGGRGLVQFAAVGVGPMDIEPAPAAGRAATLHDVDKAQVIVLQLAFWTVGVGILLGAYWADHAWGRWWAWDPKETWALITWIIYLIAIHVRFAGVRNRGLTTAWLSCLGFGAMLWCYWGVNLFLAGLHSYA